MSALELRFSPESLAATPGLMVDLLCERVWELVRERHPRPDDHPHEGPANEGVVIRKLVRPRAGGWRVEFTYECDRYPNSRYDKSEQAKGTLELAPDGAVLRARVGPLRR